MQNVDILLEHYRTKLGITEEQEKAIIKEIQDKNPVSALEQENEQLKKRVESSEGALLGLMDILMGGM